MDPLRNLVDISTMGGYEFESACRAYCLVADIDEHTMLCRILTRYKLYIDKRDHSLTPHLIMDGFWETWMTKMLAEIIQPGDTCIDIGANAGYFSILMSGLSGSEGRTIAVEPNPRLATLLRRTAGMNHPGFDVAEVALSKNEGKTTLFIPGDAWGDGSIIERSDRSGVRKDKIKIKTIPLDTLMERMDVKKVDVIKIDVEGVEPGVFEGMQQIISNNPGLKILVEYSPFLYDDPRSFTEQLFKQFEVWRIKDVSEPVLVNPDDMDSLINLKDHTDLYLKRKQS